MWFSKEIISKSTDDLSHVRVGFIYGGSIQDNIDKISTSCDCSGYTVVNDQCLIVKINIDKVKDKLNPRIYESGTRNYTKLVTVDVVDKDNKKETLKIHLNIYEQGTI
jgi:hypothetical protein